MWADLWVLLSDSRSAGYLAGCWVFRLACQLAVKWAATRDAKKAGSLDRLWAASLALQKELSWAATKEKHWDGLRAPQTAVLWAVWMASRSVESLAMRSARQSAAWSGWKWDAAQAGH